MGTADNELFRHIWKIQSEMERLVRDFFTSKNPLLMTTESLWRPPTDVYETDTDIVVKMEIAGVKQEDISIRLTGDVLTVRGRREGVSPGGRRTFRQMEINNGAFERVILITEVVDRNRIKASYKDGFLEIVIPKVQAVQSKPIEIEVRE
ncbi:MAG TPA: Hsp20/alpha crystallin family protein [Candidatus Latescibacteria bacterium]|nr:Hsp20/alpha crystallin family protein [Candidatus Latescibacterota bacterium]